MWKETTGWMKCSESRQLTVRYESIQLRELSKTLLFRNAVRQNEFYIDSFLSAEDHAVLLRTGKDAADVQHQTSSLTGLMNHLENRGHAAAPFVEGLTVELLPFQLQSLQWAIERETTPGGLQSFFWTKLPSVEQPNTTVYYNPILGKLSTSKPNLVRGGIIAEQMGLGKTVISLALILQNPAPTLLACGSLATSITAQPSLAPGQPFWDPDLHSRTSGSKKKRGSILSRGTLVVVSALKNWPKWRRGRYCVLFLLLL